MFPPRGFIVAFAFAFFLIPNSVYCQDDDHIISPKEIDALNQLRNLIGDEQYDDYTRKGFTIIHFLRAKNLDVGEANKAILAAIDWRQENRIDDIENEVLLPGLYPYEVKGVDRKGRPVAYISPPRWDIRKIVLSGKLIELQRYFTRFLEISHSRILGAGNSTENRVTQITCVLDVDGYNLRQHACVQCIPVYLDWIRTYFRYYPQDFGQILWINVPRIAHPVVEILKAAMDPQMRKALKVYGTEKQEWVSGITKIIHPSQLLVKYGGELK